MPIWKVAANVVVTKLSLHFATGDFGCRQLSQFFFVLKPAKIGKSSRPTKSLVWLKMYHEIY